MYKFSNLHAYMTSVQTGSAEPSTWDSVKKYFTETLDVRVVEPPQSAYALVRYVKGKSDLKNALVRELRSVVIHKETLRIVSVAPSLSTPYSVWWGEEHTVTAAQEFIDGTMLNIFRGVDGEVHLASRSRVGESKTQFSEKTFTAMMEDALSITPIKNYKDLLPEGYQCVSVVVQHKENRVVCPVFLPKLYIVSMTKVEADGLVMSYAAADMPESHRIYAVPSYDVGALGMPAATAESVDNWIAMKALTLKQGWQGVVLYDGAGGRTKKRTTFYNDAKELRGNDRCMEERYARLRKARKIKKYIQLYAEDEDKFFVLEERLRAHTKSLYDYYIKTNITKTQPYDELPWPYKYHVAALHRRYKEYEKPAGGKISLPYVITYVNALDVEDAANIMKGSTADQIAATAVAQVQAEAE
jgi:hypothetical protein